MTRLDADAYRAILEALEADVLGTDDTIPEAYAQSMHCRGCIYARKLSYAGPQAPYFCDYLRLAGHKRPVPADQCPGYGRSK